MIWKAVLWIVVIIGAYMYMPEGGLKNGIDEKLVNPALEKLNITEDNSETSSQESTNSSYNPTKIELGKITRSLETDCLLDSECIETYGEGSICESGICYQIS